MTIPFSVPGRLVSLPGRSCDQLVHRQYMETLARAHTVTVDTTLSFPSPRMLAAMTLFWLGRHDQSDPSCTVLN